MKRRKRDKYKYTICVSEPSMETEEEERAKKAVVSVIIEGYSACPGTYRPSGVLDLDLGSSSQSSSAVRYEAFVGSC